jgi:ATP adenylyltransferase
VTAAPTPHSRCVFCDAAAGIDPEPRQSPPPGELVLVRGRTCFVVLNLYPYNNGHLMVVPNRHLASLAATSPEELTELMQFTRDGEMALGEAYQPQGINVGINLGRAAGAGIADHLHIHLVPRWSGDTNFMSVFGETRVLPESLEQTAARLRPIFARLAAERS